QRGLDGRFREPALPADGAEHLLETATEGVEHQQKPCTPPSGASVRDWPRARTRPPSGGQTLILAGLPGRGKTCARRGGRGRDRNPDEEVARPVGHRAGYTEDSVCPSLSFFVFR